MIAAERTRPPTLSLQARCASEDVFGGLRCFCIRAGPARRVEGAASIRAPRAEDAATATNRLECPASLDSLWRLVPLCCSRTPVGKANHGVISSSLRSVLPAGVLISQITHPGAKTKIWLAMQHLRCGREGPLKTLQRSVPNVETPTEKSRKERRSYVSLPRCPDAMRLLHSASCDKIRREKWSLPLRLRLSG